MYEVIYTGQFKRSMKLCVRRGLDVTIFTKALDILQEKGELPPVRKTNPNGQVSNVLYCVRVKGVND